MAPRPRGSTEPWEGTSPSLATPKVITILPFLEVAIAAKLGGIQALPTTIAALKSQPMGSMLADPSSSMARIFRVTRVSTMVPPHALVTLDMGLAKRLLGFILQPRDHRERAGRSLGDTITEVFPQLLMVSLFPFFFSSFSCFFFFVYLSSSRLMWQRGQLMVASWSFVLGHSRCISN